jgi:ABC-2 type transport system permease protein
VYRYIKLYLKSQSSNIASELQYKANFIIMIITVITEPFAGLFAFFILTDKFKMIGGWTFWQISLMYGILRIGHSTAIIFFQQGWDIGNYIRNGEFDILLIRPWNILAQLFCKKFQKIGLPDFIAGNIIIAVALSKLNINLLMVGIIFLIVTVLSAAIIEMSITLLVSSFSFWLVDVNNLLRVALNIQYELMNYPVNIYNHSIQFLLTFILPYAFMSFYPSQHFISNGGQLSPLFVYGSPIVAVTMAIFAITVFNIGINHYQSTGN